MIREQSSPPSYHSQSDAGSERYVIIDEQSSLLQQSRQMYHSTTLKKDTVSSNPDGPSRKSLVLAVLILICLTIGPLFGILGACIDRSLSVDPSDPRIRDRIRREWNLERERHANKVQEYRDEEIAVLGRIREYEDGLEREKREREMMRLYWADVEPVGQCLGVGTRKYKGRLGNFHPSVQVDAFAACKATSVVINGKTYDSPSACELQVNSEIYGYWTVNNHVACASYWEFFYDKGCVGRGSGYRRFEGRLGGIRPEDNPEMMCFSTPATLLGNEYEHPTSCPKWGNEWWGIWNIPDQGCR